MRAPKDEKNKKMKHKMNIDKLFVPVKPHHTIHGCAAADLRISFGFEINTPSPISLPQLSIGHLQSLLKFRKPQTYPEILYHKIRRRTVFFWIFLNRGFDIDRRVVYLK